MKRKSILIVISARDFNETEFLTVKRELGKNGYDVFAASDSHGLCSGDRGLKTKADIHFYNINPNNFEALIIIGGKGILNYIGDEILLRIIDKFHTGNKITASICAAGLLLAKAGVLKGFPATCYPDLKSELEKEGAEYIDAPVVVHKNIITAQNPAAAQEFVQAVLNRLK